MFHVVVFAGLKKSQREVYASCDLLLFDYRCIFIPRRTFHWKRTGDASRARLAPPARPGLPRPATCHRAACGADVQEALAALNPTSRTSLPEAWVAPQGPTWPSIPRGGDGNPEFHIPPAREVGTPDRCTRAKLCAGTCPGNVNSAAARRATALSPKLPAAGRTGT